MAKREIGRLRTSDGYVWLFFDNNDTYAIRGTVTGWEPMSAHDASMKAIEAGWAQSGDEFEVVSK